MPERLIKMLPVIAAASAVSLAGSAFAATYSSVNAIPLPYSSGFGNAAGQTSTYSAIGLTAVARTTLPNGAYSSTLVGTLTGTVTGLSSASVSTAYAYDPTNGLRLIGLYTQASTGAHTNASVRGFNAIGQVIGYSPINSPSSSDTNSIFGQEGWLYSTSGNSNIAVGLTGPNLSYTKQVAAGSTAPVAFSGTYRNTTPAFVNNSGVVVGTTNRYAGDTTAPNTMLGTSAWIYTPGGATTEIGLTGADYSYSVSTGTTTGRFSTNSISGLTSTGVIMGSASAFYDSGSATVASTGVITNPGTALGNDGWVSVGGAAPTAIGLYRRGIDPDVQGFNTAGYKYYFTPASGALGTTAATSQSRTTTLAGLNSSGQVIGSNPYYSGTGFKGTDAFVYSAATATYRQLGFYSNGFTSTTPAAGSSSFVSTAGARSSGASYINTSGQIVGTSTQYFYYNLNAVSTAGTSTIAWLDNGTGPTQIGLYGQASDANASKHVNPVTGGTSSSITNLTDSGFVGGNSSRFYLNGAAAGNLGQDAWVYDSSTGTTYVVDPTDAASSNYTSSSITYLSEDGYAVGQYSLSTTTASSSVFKAFIWSVAGGFVDLGTSLSPSMTASGYQNLITGLYSGAGGSVVYSTAALTGAASPTTIGALLVLTVPEPTSLSAVAVGGLLLVSRRRSRVA